MWSDAQWKPSRGDGIPSFNRVAYCLGKSGWFYVRRDDDHLWVGSRGDPVVPRKASTRGGWPPVP